MQPTTTPRADATDAAAKPAGPALPVLSQERRDFPRRERQRVLKEVDENGDVIFRFRLEPPQPPGQMTLEEFYRDAVHDLLRVVRLSHNGKPLIVDGFAFLNAPERVISLVERGPAAE